MLFFKLAVYHGATLRVDWLGEGMFWQERYCRLFSLPPLPAQIFSHGLLQVTLAVRLLNGRHFPEGSRALPRAALGGRGSVIGFYSNVPGMGYGCQLKAP